MYRYSYTKAVNTDKLEAELKVTNLPYSYLETVGTNEVHIFMHQELSNTEELALTNLVQSHSTTTIVVTPAEQVKKRILSAMAFGRDIIAEYGASNVLAGYSVEQIQIIMDKTAKVQMALNTGSLYVALSELDQIEIDGVLVTGEKLTEVRHKIQDYLGIPRT